MIDEPRILIRHIIEATCQETNVPETLLLSQRRQRTYTWPRQIAMTVAARIGRSLPEVGRHFGRDHTTVLHAIRKVEAAGDRAERLMAAIDERARRIAMREASEVTRWVTMPANNNAPLEPAKPSEPRRQFEWAWSPATG